MSGMPDLLGFITYAGALDPIQQAGRLMRNYKNPYPGSAYTTVALLAALALRGHSRCAASLLDQPVSAWATVPSLPPKDSPHALNKIVRSLSRRGSTEIVLSGIANPANPREVNGAHFTVHNPQTGGHVLLIDDTWTSGGHALSAALALRTAGAEYVSVLALARWLKIGWEATTEEWARRQLATDYSPQFCPWTQGGCP